MNRMSGMNSQEVRELARQLDASAEETRRLARQLTTQLEAAQWKGPDRERFLGEWQSLHLANILRVADGLSQASRRASVNADEQESASY